MRMTRVLRAALGLLLAGGLAPMAAAQRQSAPPPAPAAAPQPAPPPAAPAPTPAPSWESFSPMLLERVYRGPLRDTVVQRFRDPVDGTVCFLYIPISAPLLPPQPASPYVQYGPNTIGSISCTHPTQMVQIIREAPPQAAAPAPRPDRAAAAQPRPSQR
jgi:hypothetical protein